VVVWVEPCLGLGVVEVGNLGWEGVLDFALEAWSLGGRGKWR
jgi:hypothetical protein